MWALLIDAVSQQAWLGYGWLQVGAAQLEAANRHPMTEELWLQGHNLILDLVVWCGVPLGVLLASLVLYWYVSRACRVRTLESVAGMLVVSIVGVHAMLELPHHYLYFLIPVGFWIGQIESSLTESRVQSRQVWNWIPVALSIGIAAMILRDYGKLEDDFRLVRFESLRIGSIRASQPAPDAPALSSLTAFLRFSRSTPHAGMNAVELADAEAITKRYPYGPSLAKCATALALNNRLAEAKQMSLSIRQIHGERIYRRLRGDLREQIETGQKELVPLDRALPG
jgi:hypothetical protein